MKRYWKLAVLIPLIVLGIGTYYVEASTLNHPNYYLKTLEGSEQAAASVQLQAQYGSERFLIGTGGSDYQSSQSFWASLDATYYPTNALKNLAKEYPQFMRGKRNPNGFYVDDNVVGYANIRSQNPEQPDFRLDVSVYDKKQKVSSSFTVDIPKKNVSSSVFLYQVNISGQTIELFTLNAGGAEAPAIHLYTLDLHQKRLVSDQTLLSASGSPRDQAEIRQASPSYDLKPPSDYAVFQVTRFNTVASGASSNLQNSQLYVYDIKSGKLSTIENPTLDSLLKNTNGGQQMNQIGNQLYLITQSGPGSPQRVVQYDLTEQKIQSQFTIEPKDLSSTDGVINFSRFYNHQLYLMVTSPSHSTPPTLAIISLDTGKVLYEGIVARKDNQPVQENLQFYNVTVNGTNQVHGTN